MNLHEENQKIQGTCTTKDKIPKEIFNFEFFYDCKQSSIKNTS